MLNPQTHINGIDGFLKSHILPDLPNRMIDYISKADQIYLAASWNKQGDPTLLPQSAEGVGSLGSLLSYFRVKSKNQPTSSSFLRFFGIF